ncbi:MAG: hypothetical protein M1524_04415 [Patescibacteria group bacterium]|nr:hypothetical protein [Patescibacteria group bacterium]
MNNYSKDDRNNLTSEQRRGIEQIAISIKKIQTELHKISVLKISEILCVSKQALNQKINRRLKKEYEKFTK